MDIEEFNYKTLRKIQQIEEENPSISKINPDFYKKFFNYIKNLELRFENESNKQKKIILKNEINNTKKIIRNIYEQREKKILHSIMTRVRGGEPNLKNLINTEKKLFEEILEILVKQRQQNLETKNKTFNNDNTKIIKTEKKNLKDNRKIFLVKENIPEFIGTDARKYILRKDDIIVINKTMSELLLKRGVVREIKDK